MPEGHTIHRTARLQRKLLCGREVRADSPQGRFADGAAIIDGQRVTAIEAYGKHLFYRWSRGDTLHVHLGLYGKFMVHPRDEAPLPTAGTRLRLTTDEHVLHLAGPTACDLVDAQQEQRIVGRLGPDPLRADADPERAWAALRRRTIPISAALLDQKIICGIGNVYRAEVLFTNSIGPFRTARDLDRPTFEGVWTTIVEMLRDGERAGRIVTVDPADVGVRSRSRVPASERVSAPEAHDFVYVYKRTGLPCRRCGTPVLAGESALRTIFWCPWHQPE